MGLDLGLILGDCLKNLRHSMPDVVLYHIAHEKHRQKHSHTGIDEIKGAVGYTVKPRSYGMVNEFDGTLEQDCGKTACDTHEKG